MDKAALTQEIKKRLSLSSVVKSAVNLRGSGPSFIGLCPFHEEKTPSFHVRDQLGRFKCFGCGAAGDVIEFVMRLRGLQFNEAVLELSEAAGLETKKNLPLPKKAQDVLKAQAVAQEYFLKQLKENPVALKYLSERGLSVQMINQAALGFGGDKESFIPFLIKRGIGEQCAIKAGLLKPGRVLQFAGRITFPIRNYTGQIIAFGGRIMPGAEGAKYVNTHNYEHYEKRKNFYGLFEAKAAILKGQAPILVEGYFDAMAFWSIGIPALALCGTALSADHIALIKRLSSRLALCFDADKAGVLALRNSLMELYQKDLNPSLVLLNQKDPGAYLESGELSALKEKLENQSDALCFLIDKASEEARGDISERIKQMDWLMPVLSLIKRPLVRRQYVAYLAKNLHEDPSLLWWEISKKMPKNKPLTKKETVSLSAKDRFLLRIMLADKGQWEKIKDLVAEDLLEIYELIQNLMPEQLRSQVAILYPELWPAILEVLDDPMDFSPEEVESYIEGMRKKASRASLKAALKKKGQELEQLEKTKNFSEALIILKEKSAMLSKSKPKKVIEAPKIPEVPKKVSPITQVSPVLPPKNQAIEEPYFDPNEDWF